ncbi:alanine racemase [Mollicutes bacterium LVI A0078]|nr:alanine racemase [Mollicutes bacterium LVI A0075]WOO90622.1 alanine racemase [Mollicutes bacterium LVI A0078]
MNHLLKLDKNKVEHNIEKCRGDKDVCLMVKANCYGMGNTGLQLLLDLGYKFFGVSTLEEALNVRRLSSSAKILIVSYIAPEDVQVCIDNNITITVYDFTILQQLTSDSLFHLKVDTNMGRLGFQLDELDDVCNFLIDRHLYPEGIFSHLACASDEVKTKEAITNFEYALNIFEDFKFEYIHLLNTYGSLNYDTEFDNLVRIGIGMWGYLADQNEAELSRTKLDPALSLDLTISHVKDYDGYVSYDHLDNVEGTVLTIPLGYHDGFGRAFRGYAIPSVGTVVGNVNMCQHMVLADEGKTFNKGQLVTLFTGNQLYDLCKHGKMTTYEFLVHLSNRIERVTQ